MDSSCIAIRSSAKQTRFFKMFIECHEALGVERGAISDAQISASSEWDANHAAIQGRLHFQATGNKQGAWSAKINDANQWLQIDLRSRHNRVTGVATQGRNGHGQWVTRYKVQYGDDGVNFQYYREHGQNMNKVIETVKTILLDQDPPYHKKDADLFLYPPYHKNDGGLFLGPPSPTSSNLLGVFHWQCKFRANRILMTLFKF